MKSAPPPDGEAARPPPASPSPTTNAPTPRSPACTLTEIPISPTETLHDQQQQVKPAGSAGGNYQDEKNKPDDDDTTWRGSTPQPRVVPARDDSATPPPFGRVQRLFSNASTLYALNSHEPGPGVDDEALYRIRSAVSVADPAVLDAAWAEADSDPEKARACAAETRVRVDLGHGQGEEDVVVIGWREDDPECPFNWAARRKRTVTATTCYLCALTAVNATSPGVLMQLGMERWNIGHEIWALGVFMSLFAIAVTPLVLAPMSELFGRSEIYHATSVLNTLLFLPQIWSKNCRGILASRWFQGMVSSVGNSMVGGGTIADMYRASDRGVAMNFFTLSIFAGQAAGASVFGWVGMRLGIQWCCGIMALMAGAGVVLNVVFLRETRSEVLLRRRAACLTRETGVRHVAATDLTPRTFLSLLATSALRPLQYLTTEPIVTAMSAWIGFAWGCVFMGTASVNMVFSQYGWNIGLVGLTGLCTLVGALLGWACNYHNERLYANAAARAPDGRAAPEVRLYWAAAGGILFPVCMYGFAWTGQPQVYWLVPALFLCGSFWGVYLMYCGVYTYLSDAYEVYSSSAQAAQSFVRNVLAAVFPLFSRQMYTNLGYPIASTVAASIGLVLAAAPVLLIVYGERLRRRSKVASAIWVGGEQ